MKILQIHSGRSFNGAVRYALAVSRMLAMRGHDVTILQRPNLELGSEGQLPGSIEIQSSSLRRVPAELHRIGQFCRQRRIQVIHTHKSSAHAFGALLRLFYRVPCVATAHSLRFQLHWFLNDRVICHNEESKYYMRKWNRVADKKLRQVPAFVDDSYFGAATHHPEVTRERLGIPKTGALLTTVGNVERRKGIHDLVEALPVILRAGFDPRLAIAGWFHSTGYRAEVQERARMLGVTDRLIWLTRISDTEIGNLLRATDVYVQASQVETGPLVVLEAMALGLPVVGTVCGSMPDFIQPGVTGELVPIGDATMLGNAIAGLLSDASRRRALGMAGRRRFEARFSTEANVATIEDILGEVALRS